MSCIPRLLSSSRRQLGDLKFARSKKQAIEEQRLRPPAWLNRLGLSRVYLASASVGSSFATAQLLQEPPSQHSSESQQVSLQQASSQHSAPQHSSSQHSLAQQPSAQHPSLQTLSLQQSASHPVQAHSPPSLQAQPSASHGQSTQVQPSPQQAQPPEVVEEAVTEEGSGSAHPTIQIARAPRAKAGARPDINLYITSFQYECLDERIRELTNSESCYSIHTPSWACRR